MTRKRKILGFYVVVRGEQVAWYYDRKRAVEHARIIGGRVVPEFAEAA